MPKKHELDLSVLHSLSGSGDLSNLDLTKLAEEDLEFIKNISKSAELEKLGAKAKKILEEALDPESEVARAVRKHPQVRAGELAAEGAVEGAELLKKKLRE